MSLVGLFLLGDGSCHLQVSEGLCPCWDMVTQPFKEAEREQMKDTLFIQSEPFKQGLLIPLQTPEGASEIRSHNVAVALIMTLHQCGSEDIL